MRFDLSKVSLWLPPKLHLKSIIHELLWFKGDTNIGYLQENGCVFGTMAVKMERPVYGHQWRNWNSEEIDQIKDIIHTLNQPDSRRMLFRHGILVCCLTLQKVCRNVTITKLHSAMLFFSFMSPRENCLANLPT